MNASHLWETTLDPNARILLKVEIDQIDEADQIFTALMGDLEMKDPRDRSLGSQEPLYGSTRSLWFNAQNKDVRYRDLPPDSASRYDRADHRPQLP